MKRKRIIAALVLGAVCIAALVATRWAASRSIVGRWHQVGGRGDQMTFEGGGEMHVDENRGTYTWIDDEHLRVEFAPMGGPRLIWFSPRTGHIQWTNHQLGLVLRYTNEPGSFAKVRINKVLGL